MKILIIRLNSVIMQFFIGLSYLGNNVSCSYVFLRVSFCCQISCRPVKKNA